MVEGTKTADQFRGESQFDFPRTIGKDLIDLPLDGNERQEKKRKKKERTLTTFAPVDRKGKKTVYRSFVNQTRAAIRTIVDSEKIGRPPRFSISSRQRKRVDIGGRTERRTSANYLAARALCAELLSHSLCSFLPFARSLPLNATAPVDEVHTAARSSIIHDIIFHFDN